MKGWMWDVEAVMLGPQKPWSYEERAGELLTNARSVLDMGTGGGELFSEICAGYAGLAVATEAWSGNIRVAADRLAQTGIPVVHASGPELPFAVGSFDLVLNRHEELDPADLAGVVAPGDRVLTQQVGRTNYQELGTFFPRMTDFGHLFELYQEGFRGSGLTIVRAQEHESQEAYRSLSDIVYLLTVAPWTVPDFDVEKDLDALLDLERGLLRRDQIVLTHSRFIIEARKAPS